MVGRLKRIRNRDTGAIVGYIFDGVQYDAQQFHRQLQELLKKNDPWAQAVVTNLQDFASLRPSAAPNDPELVRAELADIDFKTLDPDTTEVEKVNLRDRARQLRESLSRTQLPPRGSVNLPTPQTQQEVAQLPLRPLPLAKDDVPAAYRGIYLSLRRALGRDPTMGELTQLLAFLGTTLPAERRTNVPPGSSKAREPEVPRARASDGVSLDLEQAKKLDERTLLELAQRGHPAARLEMRRRGLVMPGTLAESLVKNPITRTIAGVPTGLISSLTAGALQPKIARVAGEEEAPKLTPAGKVLEVPAHMVGFFVGPYKVMRPLATPVTQAVVKRLGPKVAPSVLPYIAALTQGLGEGAVYGVLETMARDFDMVREIQRRRGTGVAISFIARRAQDTALGFGISLAAMHGIMDMISKARLSKRALSELAKAVREGAGK